MSTFEQSPVVDNARRLEGCVIVMGALLRAEHPADALAWLGRVAAEAGIPCDINLLGQEGDTERFVEAARRHLPITPDGAHLGSGCYARVLEASS